MPFGFARGQDGPYYLEDNPGFVEKLRSLQNKYTGQIRYNVHGLHHKESDANPNDEFLYASDKELSRKLQAIEREIDKNPDLFVYDGKKGFRPPGWKISQLGVDRLIEFGYTHLSLLRPKRKQFYDHLNFGKLNIHWCNCAPPNWECWGRRRPLYHISLYA